MNTQDQRLATAGTTMSDDVDAVRCIRWFYCEHKGVNNMAYVPPMKPIPPNADAETRRRMYWEYVDLCVELNPGSFLPVGVKKQWWHFLKIEHPETSRSRSDISHPIWPPPQSRPAETRQSLRAAGVEQ